MCTISDIQVVNEVTDIQVKCSGCDKELGRFDSISFNTLSSMVQEHIKSLELLQCCVCIYLEEEDLPEDYDDSLLTVVNGSLVCVEHAELAGPNQLIAEWIKLNKNL